jgi:hypothetical protein
MRAREWKKAIEDEKARLLTAAEAEREHGDRQQVMAYEKAKQYETTAASLQNILDVDAAGNGDDDDDDDDDGVENELVGEGSKSF